MCHFFQWIKPVTKGRTLYCTSNNHRLFFSNSIQDVIEKQCKQKCKSLQLWVKFNSPFPTLSSIAVLSLICSWCLFCKTIWDLVQRWSLLISNSYLSWFNRLAQLWVFISSWVKDCKSLECSRDLTFAWDPSTAEMKNKCSCHRDTLFFITQVWHLK